MSVNTSHQEPLAGIRVVEIASRIAGPFAARILAEAGADVVKVEPPAGDPARRSHPVGFATWNRSKRGIVLDLDRTEGRKSLHDLLARADVLIHDRPAGPAGELGIDDARAAERHPHLIVGAVPPYPAGHPQADEPAADSLVQAATGLMDEQQGHRAGPVYIRLPFPSWCAAYMLAAGVLARLAQRERTGVIAPVSTSLWQGGLAPTALFWSRWERLPALPPGQAAPLGSGRGHTLPKLWPDAALSIFQCADGRWVQLAGAVGGWIESPPILEALALADEVELSEVGVTPDNRPRWNAVFRSHTAQEWTSRLRACDVPCVVASWLGECFSSEQSVANCYVVEVEDPLLGRLVQAGAPVTLGEPVVATHTLSEDRAGEITAGWTVRSAARRDGPAPKPLAGMRALDFGAAVAGPFGAQCLGDLGADVIKVEPITGDRGRSLTQFAGCHRGKRALAIDLKAAEGQDILRRLIAGSDFVVHNMRLPAAARLGIDGPHLRETNPQIVFSHISAYGTEGPWADDPGYDPTAQAVTGWEHANAGDGMPPIWLRNSVFDVQSGLAACVGAMLGLVQRERTGVAGEARTSLLAVGISSSSEVAVDAGGHVTAAEILTADQTGVSPSQRIYQLRDGWIAIAALEPDERATLERILGEAAGREARLSYADVAPTLRALHAAGVPAAPVALDQMDSFFDSAMHRRLGQARRLQTSAYGRIDVVGGFWTLGDERPDEEGIPDFGENSREILAELGVSATGIDELLATGVVAERRAAGCETSHA